jgi:hypothetical protein
MSNETPPDRPRKDRGGPVVNANWVLALVALGLLIAALVLYSSLRAAR